MFTKEMEAIRDQMKSNLDIVPMFATIEKSIVENPTNLDLMADVTFLVRKSQEILEAVEKRLRALESKAAQAAVEVFNYTEEKKYSSENCTISNNSDIYVKYPASPDKEGYDAFVKQLPTAAVRPHFPTILELIMKDISEGKQIPFGLPEYGLLSTNFKLRMTPKKEL